MKNIRIFIPLFACFALCFFIFGCGNATGGGGGGGGGGGTTIYTLTLTVTTEISTNEIVGTVETTPAGRQFPSGTVVTLEASTLEAAYMFKRYTGDVTGENWIASFTMDSSKVVTAEFKVKPPSIYMFTAYVTPEGAGTVEPWAGAYTAGTNIWVTADAIGLYTFDHWELDETGTTNPLPVSMTATKEVRAVFKHLYTLSVNVTPENTGTVEPFGGTFIEGTVVDIIATPETGYAFSSWEGGLSSSVNPTTITMDSTKDVTAVFVSSTVYVSTSSGDDGSGDGSAAHPYKTIQKGLDMVPATGTVSVDAGVYTENISWPTKLDITLRGASMSTTTIDANSAGRGIEIAKSISSPISSARIERMTIINGKSTSRGAGIFFQGPNATLYLYDVCVQGCSVEAASAYGGGIDAYDINSTDNSYLYANCCIITNNSAMAATPSNAYGGGLYASNVRIAFSSCEVSYNTSSGYGGGVCYGVAPLKIENAIIHHNIAQTAEGGGIYSFSSGTYRMINCTITSNEAVHGKGGGIATYYGLDKIDNCIVWGNTASASDEIWVDPGHVAFGPEVHYSDIMDGFTGTGNKNIDPLFESVTDLHLTSSTSTEITEGGTSSNAPAVDYDGNDRTVPYSMGAFEED